jgi:hypothetical protein
MGNELLLWVAVAAIVVLAGASLVVAWRHHVAVATTPSPVGPGAVMAVIPRAWRMGAMALSSTVLTGGVAVIARQQLGILVFKACVLTLAAVIGYWIDRTAFPDTRPHLIGDPQLRWRYEWRRAAIMAAALLTAGLGA